MNYLIKDTTEDERRELFYKALGISLSGAKAPSKRMVELANLYIEGKLELDEIKKIIIEEYSK